MFSLRIDSTEKGREKENGNGASLGSVLSVITFSPSSSSPHDIGRIYHQSLMHTEKSLPNGKQIMLEMRSTLLTRGWDFLVCIGD